MLNRCLFAALVLVAAITGAVRASDSDAAAGDRTIIAVPQPPFKNPGILTLGTLAIQQGINFSINVITSNGNKAGGTPSFVWDWGDGTPTSTGAAPSHTYLVAGFYTVTVTCFESGVAGPVVDSSGKVVKTSLGITITDAIKSAKLLTLEDWGKKNDDRILLSGVIRVRANQPLAGKIVDCDIGGVLLNFKLDAKGSATLSSNANNVQVSAGAFQSSNTCKATFKLFVRKRSKGSEFVDSKFLLTYKNGSVQDAFAFPALITNRNASRDNVRITCKITYDSDSLTNSGILFQSGINSVFTSTMGKIGKTK